MIHDKTEGLLPVDIEQAQRMLSILGYKPGDRISLRLFGQKAFWRKESQ